jgi:hypothetical protein
MTIPLTLKQIDRIAQLCDFVDHPGMKKAVDDSVPVTMPHDLGSLGFDIHLWVGFAIVGLWAALDAFAERANIPNLSCQTCGRKCLSARFMGTGRINAAGDQALRELEDVRHLFAHNYAGQADAVGFRSRGSTRVPSGPRIAAPAGLHTSGATLRVLCRTESVSAEALVIVKV